MAGLPAASSRSRHTRVPRTWPHTRRTAARAQRGHVRPAWLAVRLPDLRHPPLSQRGVRSRHQAGGGAPPRGRDDEGRALARARRGDVADVRWHVALATRPGLRYRSTPQRRRPRAGSDSHPPRCARGADRGRPSHRRRLRRRMGRRPSRFWWPIRMSRAEPAPGAAADAGTLRALEFAPSSACSRR